MNHFKKVLFDEKDVYKRLHLLVKILRENCEWDKKQTLESLSESLIEEAYEVINGINSKQTQVLKEELGDLLFLVHFLIQLAEEKNYFTKEEVYNFIIHKLVERHPHVFNDNQTYDTNQILKNWENFKQKKIGEDTEYFPALLRAHKVQKKAALEGFDWQSKPDGSHFFEILNKVYEELKEFEEMLKKYVNRNSDENKSKLEMELGDVFFSLVNLARHLSISSELALQKSIDKFVTRWSLVLEEFKKNINLVNSKSEIFDDIYKKIKIKEINENS